MSPERDRSGLVSKGSFVVAAPGGGLEKEEQARDISR
jgi:hypothetical protein